MSGKKIEGLLLVAILVMGAFWTVALGTAGEEKSVTNIRGGVYNPGEDINASYGSIPTKGGVNSYANATFYTPNVDQMGDTVYDVQYEKLQYVWLNKPYAYGNSPQWDAPAYLNVTETEYMVVVETVNGVNNWSGANYTGSTNMSVTALTGDPADLPNIYLEEIRAPSIHSRDNATATINITWTGLYENISEAYYNPGDAQEWYGQAENIAGYSVFRSTNGGDFERVGNATQNRGTSVYFEETSMMPGTYQYKIAVNYRYPANDGTNIVDENGLTPANAEFLGIYVSAGFSPASESIELSDVTPPEITELQPEQGSLVNTNKPIISAVFVEEGSGINESSIVMIVAGKNILNYTYNSNTKTLSYTPTEALAEDMCTLTIDVNDNAGNPATQAYWTFTIDTVSPTIEDKLPTGEEVRVTSAVIITFNEPMNTAGLEDAFSIEPEVTGAWHWTWDPPGLTMRGTHDVPFTVDTTYICTIDAALVKDLAWNPMELDVVWNFTTASSPSVTLNSPYGLIPEDWTGGSTHEVNYTVAGGESPYTIYINYTTDNWVSSYPIGTATHDASGLYDYEWTLPLNNSEFVKVRIEVVDNVSAVHSDESNDFIVDSTAPEVNWTIPENDSEVVAQQYLIIQFTEPVDKTSVLAAFSITPDPGGWLWEWNTAGNKLTGTHNPFEIGRTYTCTISTDAKDDSSPGNNFAADYSWSFTSKLGRGDFSVSVSYASQVEVNKALTVTVSVSNTGSDAYHVSGSLNVKIYKSSDNINFFYVDDKDIVPMEANGSGTKTFTLTFDKAGKWYIKVVVSSAGDEDIIEGETQAYTTVLPVTVTSPPEEIGIGPYILIAVMIALVAVVGMLTLWGIRKKRKTEK